MHLVVVATEKLPGILGEDVRVQEACMQFQLRGQQT
ncbi:hypothetical protein PF005_g12509 [Phytophthora fragariae]|uniref:Uncharacterized protein n=2 Tax=Phytophthora TaxID=4783 RepID=A0A6A3LWY2_9STRA|nr:hypothetical protein PF003_g27637 [Phytophthora fragariae]KAE8994866.1 hypothetical protein PR001_g20276 [Phytophthora rubi]KAE8936530.1 hypothetical protein PF009_g13547 [Phytophthora fragariae]KAE9014476.1 hypothetical protein PR002_g14209 [Phytophthora rubi]KAE9024251.1 hypothetical protein PF011_g3596 [Phytophthora fragariae]